VLQVFRVGVQLHGEPADCIRLPAQDGQDGPDGELQTEALGLGTGRADLGEETGEIRSLLD